MAKVAESDRPGQASAPEPRRRAQRTAPQEHRAFQYHGSSDGSAVSGWGPGAGAGLCAPTGDGRSGRAAGRANCAPERRWATTNRRCRSGCRRNAAGAPVYRVKSESGPDHRKRFLVEVRLKTGSRANPESRWPAARGTPRSMRSRMPRAAPWIRLTSQPGGSAVDRRADGTRSASRRRRGARA